MQERKTGNESPPDPWSPAGRQGLFAFGDLIAGRGLEEISGGLGAVDVGQAKALVAGARVAVFGHDIHLQVGGVPGFGGDLDRPVIADGAGVNRGDLAHAFGVDALNHLFAERFAGRLPQGHPGSAGYHATKHPATGAGATTDADAATTPDADAATATDADAATTTDAGGGFASLISDGLRSSARLGLGHG